MQKQLDKFKQHLTEKKLTENDDGELRLQEIAMMCLLFHIPK
jgi:hypothetical protein